MLGVDKPIVITGTKAGGYQTFVSTNQGTVRERRALARRCEFVQPPKVV